MFENYHKKRVIEATPRCVLLAARLIVDERGAGFVVPPADSGELANFWRTYFKVKSTFLQSSRQGVPESKPALISAAPWISI
jgi:hypothetical protein